MVSGFARVLRNEIQALDLVTLDCDLSESTDGDEKILELVCDIVNSKSKGRSEEMNIVLIKVGFILGD